MALTNTGLRNRHQANPGHRRHKSGGPQCRLHSMWASKECPLGVYLPLDPLANMDPFQSLTRERILPYRVYKHSSTSSIIQCTLTHRIKIQRILQDTT